jgi:hyaluronan synthase
MSEKLPAPSAGTVNAEKKTTETSRSFCGEILDTAQKQWAGAESLWRISAGYCAGAGADLRDKFMRNAESSLKMERNDFVCLTVKILTVLLFTGTLLAVFNVSASDFEEVYFRQDTFTKIMNVFGIVLLVISVVYYGWLAWLAFLYRPVQSKPDRELPGCTVIVPAYNEGRMVFDTLKSLLASNYPVSKLQIVAVNDGSKDDTWDWIKKAADESEGRILALNLEQNGGKRNAVYQGVLKADKEIIVTVDSDSIVESFTLRNLVSPFVGNPKIGSVAGNIRVFNMKDGVIPRMMDVSFVFNFEFMRSAQSMVRSVLCTPGALSAYRKDLLMPFMDEWVHQKFMGLPANIGEDRALANMVLERGYDIVFQENAVLHTNVPADYKGLCKMLIRWARSNIRENLYMFKFAFKEFDCGKYMGMQINLLMLMLSTILPAFFVFFTVLTLIIHTKMFILVGLTLTFLWSCFPAALYASRYSFSESVWAFTYGVYNLAALSWISVYSIFTVRKSGWLTREKVQTAPDGSQAIAADKQTVTAA